MKTIKNHRQTGASGFVAEQIMKDVQKDLFGDPIKEPVRALSWKQPFASLMLADKIETRTWYTKYRGLVLICASQSPYSESEVRKISGNQYSNMLDILRRTEPRGVAIAVGRLIDCRRMRPEDEEKCFVQYDENLWCHVYADVRQIEAFPFKGAQGWKQLTAEQILKIKYV